MIKKFISLFAIVVSLLFIISCSNYADIPPNYIGMVLTPTGYDGKILTPGQVDLGRVSDSGSCKKLVILQRSGIEVKETFTGKESNKDKEDHRCLTGGDKTPVTIDIRLLLALPDYTNKKGEEDLNRIFLLGNPVIVPDALPNGRVMKISASSIYNDQARQQVRGKIRQLIYSSKSIDELLESFTDESENGLNSRIERKIKESLEEENIPLGLISSTISNLKPDEEYINILISNQSADKRIEVVDKISKFLSADPTGGRWKVYEYQVLKEIVETGSNNGHTMVIMDSKRDIMPFVLKQ